MAYNDNKYKPDSPKKTTAKKEELIIPPNFISTPEQNIQQQLIKKIEAEARIKKPKVLSSKRSAFLNKGVKERLSGGSIDCKNPCNTILTGYGGGNGGFFYYDHNTNQNIHLSGASDNRDDVAIWGDKLYAKKANSPNPHGAFILTEVIIQEYQINYNTCSVTWLRDIPIENHVPGWIGGGNGYGGGNGWNSGGAWTTQGGPIDTGHGMDMKDANTIICGTVNGPSQWLFPSNFDHFVLEVDISGPTGIATAIFPVSTTGAGSLPCNYKAVDLIYMQDTGNYLVSMVRLSGSNCPAGDNALRLFSPSGTLLDECEHFGGLGMYRTHPNGDVFITGGVDIHAVTFGPLAVGPAIQNTGLGQIRGAAYNPDPNANCTPISNLCYDIGDIGPEGGIIFSIPGVGPNTSANTYYEVAQDDIAIGGTPSSCFNVVCGDSETTYTIANGSATHQQIDDNQFSFFWNAPPNAPYPGTPSDPPPQVGDTLTAITPNLFADALGNPISTTTITNITPSGGQPTGQGPLTITIADQFTPTLGTNVLYAMPFELDITSQLSPLCTGFTITGAEWGVHNKPNIITSTDFGTGHINTDAIDAYPLLPGTPTGGINPWLDSHDIAATLCKQHGFTNDWFLPSRDELMEIMNQPLVVSQLGLNALPGFQMEHAYWTSSQYRQDPTNPIQDPHKYSWSVWNVGAGTPMLAYRCHALSVRPIRKFECVPEPPCVGPSCVDYNYRDGWCGQTPGWMCSWGLDGGTQQSPIYAPAVYAGGGNPNANWSTTPGTPQSPQSMDSIIGGNLSMFKISKFDVKGHEFTQTEIEDDSEGYTITVWDADFAYLGKWHYADFDISSSLSTPFASWGRTEIWLKNVTHLDGPYPVIDYSRGASFTGAYFKIEWAATNNQNYVFENGVNNTWIGNMDSSQYANYCAQQVPFVCIPQSHWNATPAGLYTGNCWGWAGTYDPALCWTCDPVYPSLSDGLAAGNCDSSNWSAPWAYPNNNCKPCDYQVGDIGPAGGIIVTTPNSPNSTYNASQVYGNVGDTGSNDSDYYYELSPVDLNDPTASHPNAEWGNFETTNGIDLTSVVDNGGILSVDALNNGEINTTDLMTTNPTANLNFPCGVPICVPSAPEICDSYSLNGYNDWFLPSVHEWSFVRNNIPSISTGPTRFDNLYWTSNFWDTGVLGNNAPVTSGPISCTVMGNVPPGSSDGTYSAWSALVIDANTPSVSVPDPSGMSPELMYWHWVQNGWSNAPYPDYYLAYHVPRWLPSKVRAMRRFQCVTLSPVARSLPEIETVINDETPANVFSMDDGSILDVNDETTSETKSY